MTVTSKQFAELAGVSEQRVRTWCRRGDLPTARRNERGQWLIDDPERAFAAWREKADHSRSAPEVLERAIEAGRASPETLNATDARARKTHWEAEHAELKFRREAGELVPAADVERRLVDVFTAAKTRLLELPSRARQQIPHLTNDDVELLTSIVREALEHLAAPGVPR